MIGFESTDYAVLSINQCFNEGIKWTSEWSYKLDHIQTFGSMCKVSIHCFNSYSFAQDFFGLRFYVTMIPYQTLSLINYSLRLYLSTSSSNFFWSASIILRWFNSVDFQTSRSWKFALASMLKAVHLRSRSCRILS